MSVRARRRAIGLAVVLVVLAAFAGIALADSGTAPPLANRVAPETSPSQLTGVPFGLRSFWLQPWRAYQATPPASQLTDGLGVSMSLVATNEADAAARALSESGFRHLRVEIGWGNMAYDGSTLTAVPSNLTRIRAILAAAKAHGLRPLILLNANSGSPVPHLNVANFRLAKPATLGARTVQLSPTAAQHVVVGHTGIAGKYMAEYLITKLTGTTAKLSQPLGMALPANQPLLVNTLQYLPFLPNLRDGSLDPQSAATLAGWDRYVRAVMAEVRSDMGSDQFDVEIWNEMTFGSEFLSGSHYYEHVRGGDAEDAQRSILSDSVKIIHSPISALPDVRVGDGFSNTRPFDSASSTPNGVDALDKHPYTGIHQYSPQTSPTSLGRPVNAQGAPEGTRVKQSGGGSLWRDAFVPTFTALFPEYHLSVLQTESQIRDIAPFATMIQGKAHGANVPHADGSQVQHWVTEFNFSAAGFNLDDPANANRSAPANMTYAENRYIQQKALLRFVTAYANKGFQLISLYTAKSTSLGLIDDSFWPPVDGGTYPGTAAAGSILGSFHNLTAALTDPSGTGITGAPRPIALDGVSDDHNHTQFTGDGTAAHPSLYDRDVVAFLPFQVNDHRWVASTYVMTRNMTQVYDMSAPKGDEHRFDMPPETFRLDLGGMDAAHVSLSLTDPMTGAVTAVSPVSTSDGELVVDLPLTDSVQLLTMQENSTADGGTSTKPAPVPPVTAPTPVAAAVVGITNPDAPRQPRIAIDQVPVTDPTIDYVQLQRRDGAVGSDGSCSFTGPFAVIAPFPRSGDGAALDKAGAYRDDSVTPGSCYRYQALTVGLNGTVSTSNHVDVTTAAKGPRPTP